MRTTKRVAAIVGGVILVIALCIAAWQLNWFVAEKNQNRQAEINAKSYNRQSSLVTEIVRDIRDAETPNIPAAQRAAIVNRICDDSALLTGTIQLSISTQRFINKECPA